MFYSTRSNRTATSSKAIYKGLSEDGGLYVFNQINSDFFNETLLTLTYQELAETLFSTL